jgi:hypothetical protein
MQNKSGDMREKETLYAVNTRIDRKVAERMNELLAMTKKSTAAFVQDAIIEYLSQVFQKGYKPSKALQIDKFAANIN